MSDSQARQIVKTIQKGNVEASVALIKTFGLVKLQKPKRPVYQWIVKPKQDVSPDKKQ